MNAADLLGIISGLLGALATAVVGWQARREARISELAYLHSAKLQDEVVERTLDPGILGRHIFQELGEIEVSAYATLPDLRKRVDFMLSKIETMRFDFGNRD